jgi:hypothetical protein
MLAVLEKPFLSTCRWNDSITLSSKAFVYVMQMGVVHLSFETVLANLNEE